ncbi:acetylglutamate kinase [Alicyclobacillus sp.]|uniref:acetylglutamate kinase n=1 Tax=Alicyclobacillus sp. TaxID=61169 RepID=UPI0025BC2A14|nr:acetylglutamate kinase [Alicyclobacillus sp.]MCL6517513.1 acetylglutamate kinase [Alicyclobacillus sp.]
MQGVVVVKVGGSLRGEGGQALAACVGRLAANATPVVVVHGGVPRITEALKARGIELPFVDGHRLTTPEAVEVVDEVLCRQVNPELVAQLAALGVPAIGVTSADGVVCAQPMPGLQRTGRVDGIEGAYLERLLAAGRVPVVAPVGVDAAGGRYNINADLTASAIGAALGAQRVVFLTDVPGIYEDFEAKRLLTQTTAAQLARLMEEGRFTAGMIPKVSAVLAALQGGAREVLVIDGRDALAVECALTVADTARFAHGTLVKREEAAG